MKNFLLLLCLFSFSYSDAQFTQKFEVNGVETHEEASAIDNYLSSLPEVHVSRTSAHTNIIFLKCTVEFTDETLQNHLLNVSDQFVIGRYREHNPEPLPLGDTIILEGFPVYEYTGDAVADREKYAQARIKWIAENNKTYEKLRGHRGVVIKR